MASNKPGMAVRARPPAAAQRPALAVLPGGGREGAQTAAVIDLGSNSWRLVAYRYLQGGAWWRLGQLQEPVRIAEGLARSSKLSANAVARGMETLDMFARYCRARGIEPGAVNAVATSAIRDAANGDDLRKRAEKLTGFDIRVLSAQQEADYGYLAAVSSTTLRDGTVLDLGGGSMQLVAVRERRATAFGSWPLGAVRISERLLPDARALSRKELKRARTAVRAEVAETRWANEKGHRVVGMGGAVRNLAAAALRASGLGDAGVQGDVLRAAELRELVAALARRPATARALPGIKPARADVILGAALVLEAMLDREGFDGIEVTRAGLREGVFFATRLRPEAEPLVADVRAASVRNLAVQCHADLAHADHVAELAAQMHDSLAAEGVIAPAPDERELLWAASMLHDVGMTIGYDGHAAHSRYVILNAGLAGFGPREVAVIAQIVRYHRKGTPDLDDLRPLAREGDGELVQRCALLLRVAEQLERGEGQSVHAARLVADRNGIRLLLDGDDRLALWSLERQLGDEAFRRVFGRRLVVER
jgi:exopolyphosphatase/guanosine-5'-triphosphate,3'-diphosphate pyrophosphatase